MCCAATQDNPQQSIINAQKAINQPKGQFTASYLFYPINTNMLN